MRKLYPTLLLPLFLVTIIGTTVYAADIPAESCTKSGGSWDGDKKECNFVGDDGKPDLSKIKGSSSLKIRACLGSDGVWKGDSCETKKGNSGSLTDTIQNVVNVLLFLAGSMAVIVIILAGFRFVTANGDSQAVSKARSSIIYATIGIVVAISAYAIVNFILDQL